MSGTSFAIEEATIDGIHAAMRVRSRRELRGVLPGLERAAVPA